MSNDITYEEVKKAKELVDEYNKELCDGNHDTSKGGLCHICRILWSGNINE